MQKPYRQFARLNGDVLESYHLCRGMAERPPVAVLRGTLERCALVRWRIARSLQVLAGGAPEGRLEARPSLRALASRLALRLPFVPASSSHRASLEWLVDDTSKLRARLERLRDETSSLEVHDRLQTRIAELRSVQRELDEVMMDENRLPEWSARDLRHMVAVSPLSAP